MSDSVSTVSEGIEGSADADPSVSVTDVSAVVEPASEETGFGLSVAEEACLRLSVCKRFSHIDYRVEVQDLIVGKHCLDADCDCLDMDGLFRSQRIYVARKG